MSHAGHRSVELKDPGYELFIGAVSLLSIVNVVLLYVVEDLSLDTVLLVTRDPDGGGEVAAAMLALAEKTR